MNRSRTIRTTNLSAKRAEHIRVHAMKSAARIADKTGVTKPAAR
ncbi:MAG: hypothetical protein SGJ23_17515 [Alphaproteobacteria bacterium]|nr:hypothetical protein [Alphaproteobacteria bacterium]